MNTLCEEYREKIKTLTDKNVCLQKENEDLKYMLNDLQESLDIANDEAVNQMLRVCGCVEVEGARITAAYQDLVGILISNGYTVEITPLYNNTKMRIVIKESEELGNE